MEAAAAEAAAMGARHLPARNPRGRTCESQLLLLRGGQHVEIQWAGLLEAEGGKG